jgi:hypothetical protein
MAWWMVGVADLCLGVLGLCRGPLDVHAVAPGVVQLRQLHEVEHLDIAPGQNRPMSTALNN